MATKGVRGCGATMPGAEASSPLATPASAARLAKRDSTGAGLESSSSSDISGLYGRVSAAPTQPVPLGGSSSADKAAGRSKLFGLSKKGGGTRAVGMVLSAPCADRKRPCL
jgi:hypothetical protein